ncbi:MAG: (Fe-S)-binding protein [Candidatus Lokiarchaeota archaeon]|nr:(Fe-S)-binding protein [Candidatus Lokiarchaeota archaeon]
MPLEDYEDIIKKCLRCSICKWIPQIQIKSQKYASICPAIDQYNYHTYSGGGRIVLALSLFLGRIEPSEELADIVYKCPGCGGCAISCKYLNSLEPLEIVWELRNKLVEEGYGPRPKQKQYAEAAIEKHNPYNESEDERIAWAEDIETSDDAKIAYFVGCTSSYRRMEIAKATAKLLNEAGVEFQLLGSDEWCCGSPLLRTGMKDEAMELMEHNIKTMEERGIEEVVFSCAGCYSTFKAHYPRYTSYDFKVTHTSEFFNKLIDEGKIEPKKELDMIVTYHDPCHLGRDSEPYPEWNGKYVEVMPVVKVAVPPKPLRRGTHGVYDPPRDVLKKIPGIKFNEMERIKEFSYCCGAGGGVKAQYPDFALSTAKHRIDEAESTGANTLISACPFCSTNLKDAIDDSGSKLKFYDLSELLLMTLEEE